MKFYRKAAALLLAASMSFAAVSAELKQSTAVKAAEAPDPELLREYAEIIISQVNDARLSEPGVQLSELKMLPVMCDYAQVRAGELVLNFDHKRPVVDANGDPIESNIGADGNPKNCFTVIKEDGFWYNSAAENIAAGNVLPVQTFNQWMDSPSHRGNIMGEFTHIGIGYYYDPDSVYKYYWSMFLVKCLDVNGNPVVYENEYIPPRELGDADGSHVIDASDATRILQYDTEFNAGLAARVSDAFRAAADINGDGEVNSIDASILLSYIAAHGADPEAQLESFIW